MPLEHYLQQWYNKKVPDTGLNFKLTLTGGFVRYNTKMKRTTEKNKMYRVTKYIMAKDASQAIRKDKTTAVHDVWVDNDWKPDHLASAIGFVANFPRDEEN